MAREVETTAVFVEDITEYRLRVVHDGGEGEISIVVDGSTYDVLDNAGESYYNYLEEGRSVELGIMAEGGWEVDSSYNTSFTMTEDETYYIGFEETTSGGGGDNGGTGNPFDIPDSYWDDGDFMKDPVKDFLRNPSSYDKDKEIVFGFAGGFNDKFLGRASGTSSQEYAERIAKVIKKDYTVHSSTSSCVVDVHWIGWMRLADQKTIQSLYEIIQNW